MGRKHAKTLTTIVGVLASPVSYFTARNLVLPGDWHTITLRNSLVEKKNRQKVEGKKNRKRRKGAFFGLADSLFTMVHVEMLGSHFEKAFENIEGKLMNKKEEDFVTIEEEENYRMTRQ